MAPWLDRLGWKPSGKAIPPPWALSLVLCSPRTSASSDASSDRSKKLTSEGVEGPSVSPDSDNSGVSVVLELPLRLRSCRVRFLRESVPSGVSGWASAASDTLRRIGSARGAGSGSELGRWICLTGWLGVWVAQESSWEGQWPLAEELHPRAVEAWCVPPDSLLGGGWGAPSAPGCNSKGEVAGVTWLWRWRCPSEKVDMSVWLSMCVVTGKVKCSQFASGSLGFLLCKKGESILSLPP